MKILSIADLIEAYTRYTSKFCIYISFNRKTTIEEVIETTPFFKQKELEDFYFGLNICEGVLVFDTEEEMEECFSQIKDNGIVYALTCGNGEIMDEL